MLIMIKSQFKNDKICISYWSFIHGFIQCYFGLGTISCNGSDLLKIKVKVMRPKNKDILGMIIIIFDMHILTNMAKQTNWVLNWYNIV